MLKYKSYFPINLTIVNSYIARSSGARDNRNWNRIDDYQWMVVIAAVVVVVVRSSASELYYLCCVLVFQY